MANDLTISNVKTPALARNWAILFAPKTIEEFRLAPLVPAYDLPAVKRELAKALEPCNEREAAKAAGILLGYYPKHAVAEPAIYASGIRSILEDYPPAIALRAIDLVSRKCKFIPTRAEVSEECERLMGQLHWVAFIAARTEAEGKRRRLEAEERARAEASRLAFLERHNGKSPLDVMREKGLYTAREDEDGKETVSGSRHDESGDAG